MEKGFSNKWIKRFDFFEKYGVGEGERRAYIKYPFFERILLRTNFFALFFGLLYFCIIGLWRKGLTLLGIYILANFLVMIVAIIIGSKMEFVFNFMGLMYTFGGAHLVNRAYYLYKVKGVNGWNPFEGITKKSADRLNALPSRQYK